MRRYIPPALKGPRAVSGSGLFHFTFTPEQQTDRVRQLINTRFSEQQVAHLTGWSIEQIRRACAEPGAP